MLSCIASVGRAQKDIAISDVQESQHISPLKSHKKSNVIMWHCHISTGNHLFPTIEEKVKEDSICKDVFVIWHRIDGKLYI